MDHSLTEDQSRIEEAVGAICDRFDDNFWLERDRDGGFPFEFHAAMAEGGWLGIAMPEAQGGANLGIADAAVMMRRVAQSAGAMAACSSIHMNIFGPHPIVVFGTEEQKQRWLPDLIAGRIRACFGVTEPNAGLDTTNIKTRAVRTGPESNAGYTISGEKIWTSTAQVADHILLLTRTTPREDCKRPTDGLTLFFTALDRERIEVREIDKMGRKAVDSNMLFIEDLKVPAEDRIGAEGQGFECLLHGLNPERCLVAAEAIGIGQQALRRAANYARERVVFGRPIGQNQGVQHPLAESWAELEAAWLMVSARRGPVRRRQALRPAVQRRKISRRRGRLPGLRAGHPDPWRHGLRQGIPCRAAIARGHDLPDRAGVARADPQPHRRKGARPAEELLSLKSYSVFGVFRLSARTFR